jgi:hypothetical protein
VIDGEATQARSLSGCHRAFVTNDRGQSISVVEPCLLELDFSLSVMNWIVASAPRADHSAPNERDQIIDLEIIGGGANEPGARSLNLFGAFISEARVDLEDAQGGHDQRRLSPVIRLTIQAASLEFGAVQSADSAANIPNVTVEGIADVFSAQNVFQFTVSVETDRSGSPVPGRSFLSPSVIAWTLQPAPDDGVPESVADLEDWFELGESRPVSIVIDAGNTDYTITHGEVVPTLVDPLPITLRRYRAFTSTAGGTIAP